MEEGCFSSVRSRRTFNNNTNLGKLESGLYYPVYIITSSYNSPHLGQLQKMLEKEKITLSFQKSTEALGRIANTHQRRFFVVLNDFETTPTLDGQFLKLSCQIADYPKQSLEEILRFYTMFVEKEKATLNQSSVINQLIFLSRMTEKKQNISSEPQANSARIQVRSISKMVHNYKSSFPKKLFVYSNPNDQKFFEECLKIIGSYEISRVEHISRIEEYLKFLPTKEDVRFFVIMSEHSAVNFRQFFKKCDDMVVCTKTPENCVSLLKGKITQILCDLQSIEKFLAKNFNAVLKNQNTSKISTDNISDFGETQSSCSSNCSLKIQTANGRFLTPASTSPKPREQLRISQQFSLVNENKKDLNIQSSIIGLTISPLPSISGSVSKDFKVKPNYLTSAVSPAKDIQKEQITSNPLNLEQVNLMATTNFQQSPSQQSSNIFTQRQNQLLNFEDKNEKNKYKNGQKFYSSEASSDLENISQSSVNSFDENSQSSRFSQKSSKNSRIIQRYKHFKKEKINH